MVRDSRKPKFRDFLPSHIGSSFTKELSDLIANLPDDFRRNYLESEIFSKFCDNSITPADVRYQAAVAKWQAANHTDSVTNQRLLLDVVDFGYATSDDVLNKAAEFILDILGPLDVKKTLRSSNHTTGASTRVKRSSTAAYEKYTGKAHVSSSAIKHWLTYASSTQLSEQVLQLQESSVLFTVAKSSEIDRVACKEPEINMILQRAVGSFFRKKLRRVGINLNDQSINRDLAKSAVADKLGTIDLSSASDRISTQLVFRLLPVEWFWLLDDLRVKSVLVDGNNVDLHMFSSMGNGFTFELESLLFYALARSVAYFSGIKGKISVYGDDIIAPSDLCPRLVRVFSFVGFKINTKKSFWRGPFRESCGGHYHLGIDVTPFYIRGPIREVSSLIRALNQLCKWDRLVFSDINQSPYKPNSYYFTSYEVARFHLKWSKHVPSTLHGGQDVESSTSLVTGDLPRKRIMASHVPRGAQSRAKLLWWLTEKERIPHCADLRCDPKDESYLFLDDSLSLGSETPWSLYEILV